MLVVVVGAFAGLAAQRLMGASIFYFIFTNKFYYISLMEQELSTNPSGLYRESPCYTV